MPRRLLPRIDRRWVRSATYSVATLLLVVTFKTVEWLIEHKVSGGANLALPFALGLAVAIAVVFQVFHKRLEEAIAHWVNRVARTREHELRELAKEVGMIRDPTTLHRRVVERLDQVFGVKSSALWLGDPDDGFDLAASTGDATPRRVSADDPAVIHAALGHHALVPASRGSAIPAAMIWPIERRGKLRGILALGTAEARETLDEFQVAAVGRVAESLANAAAPVPGPAPSPAWPPLPAKPSIAVLPFQNLSDGAEQEYFADGTVEEITTALSRYQDLFVIARNSAFTYKGRAIELRQVGRELGVRYLLEGSVRRSGPVLRITAQLIDAASGAHLWADRVEGPVEDMFSLQDRVTAAVVGAIIPTLEQAEISRSSAAPTDNLDAYAHYLQGLSTVYELNRESNDKALAHYREAIRLDPSYALAHARATECYALRRQGNWMADIAVESAEACRLARRGVELGRNDAIVLGCAGHTLAWLADEVEYGDALAERAVSLNANAAEAWANSAWIKTTLGDCDTAVERCATALRLSPLDSRAFRWNMMMSRAHLYAGRYREAAEWGARCIAQKPDFQAGLRVATAAMAYAGDLEGARAGVARLLRLDPAMRISSLEHTVSPHRIEGNRRVVTNGLRLAGLPE